MARHMSNRISLNPNVLITLELSCDTNVTRNDEVVTALIDPGPDISGLCCEAVTDHLYN